MNWVLEHSQDSDFDDGSPVDDFNQEEDDFQMVQRSDRQAQHRRNLRKGKPCPRGIHCRKAGECGFIHTEKEKRLFDEHPKQNWLVWKTRPCCITTPFHENKKDSCPYAHGAADARCLICKMDGHFTHDCPYKIN